jgi:hypothetical protein
MIIILVQLYKNEKRLLFICHKHEKKNRMFNLELFIDFILKHNSLEHVYEGPIFTNKKCKVNGKLQCYYVYRSKATKLAKKANSKFVKIKK